MRIAFAVTMAAAALALAACGGSGDDAESEAAQREKFEDAQVKFAQCMRREGVDVGDPGEGLIRLRSTPETAPRFEKAMKKCQPILAAARPELSEEDREEFQRAAVAFAQCMRQRGIDMPDPQFDGGGVRQRMPESVNPNSRRFKDAQEACQDKLPEGRGGMRFGGPPSGGKRGSGSAP